MVKLGLVPASLQEGYYNVRVTYAGSGEYAPALAVVRLAVESGGKYGAG